MAAVTLTLGGMSKAFRFLPWRSRGTRSTIIADDFELIRYEPKPPAEARATGGVGTAKMEPARLIEWPAKDQWAKIESPTHTFLLETPVILGRHLAGAVRKK